MSALLELMNFTHRCPDSRLFLAPLPCAHEPEVLHGCCLTDARLLTCTHTHTHPPCTCNSSLPQESHRDNLRLIAHLLCRRQSPKQQYFHDCQCSQVLSAANKECSVVSEAAAASALPLLLPLRRQ